MSYDVLIERNAIREIKKFPNHDIQRIKESLKKLAGTRNIYRIRVGDYRILIELEIHTLKVFSILHRKQAYK